MQEMERTHKLIYAGTGGRPEVVRRVELKEWFDKGYVEELSQIRDIDIDMVISGLKALPLYLNPIDAPFKELSKRFHEGMAIFFKKIKDIPDYQGGELWKSTGLRKYR